MNYNLTITEINSTQAILKDQDNNLIYLPVEKLPRNICIGQVLNLQISLETDCRQNITAKEIINELLSSKK